MITPSCVLPAKVTPETRGRLIDATSKKPIPGAIVSVTHIQQDTSSSSRSGNDGYFIVPAARGQIYPMGTAVSIIGHANIIAEGYSAKSFKSVAQPITNFKYCDLGEIQLKKMQNKAQ